MYKFKSISIGPMVETSGATWRISSQMIIIFFIMLWVHNVCYYLIRLTFVVHINLAVTCIVQILLFFWFELILNSYQ